LSIWTGAPIITLPRKSKAERSLGFRSYTVVRDTYYITDEFDWVLSRYVGRHRYLLPLVSCLGLVVICLLARQVHAFADGGILPSRRPFQFNPTELRFYRILGIRLLVWTYGADVRTRDQAVQAGEPNCCTDCDQVGVACVCRAGEASRNHRNLKRAALAIFSMGDMVDYVPGSRNDLFYWPIDLDREGGRRYEPFYPGGAGAGPLRIVHAPNHRRFKGTRYLEAAVERLKAQGRAIELVLVEKVSNREALEIYRSADVVFDQCLIGFHGYFALEAMALGKPVICFIRHPERDLLDHERCPMILTHRDRLVEDLERLIDNRHELEGIGRESRLYIERNYGIEAFAARLGNCYRELGILK
jgi:glycosyltransferase involved in cell wall biosynthesis